MTMSAMKNMYGETVIPQYEVVLEVNRGSMGSPDYESVDFIVADNYREAAKTAKEESKKHDGIMERVFITCYFEDDVSSYNEVWWEYYDNGHKDKRYINYIN